MIMGPDFVEPYIIGSETVEIEGLPSANRN